MRLPLRRDRAPGPVAPGPVTQAMQPPANPSHIGANTTTTNAITDSQGYTPTPSYPGFASMHGFPSFSAPVYPMQYPGATMPTFPMPSPMYPYSYPFAPQGAQVMQLNGYPVPPGPFSMMQNYPMAAPNYSTGMPVYPPPSGHLFAMPTPRDSTNFGYPHKHEYSMSGAHAISNPVQDDEVLPPNTDLSPCEWLVASERTPTPEPQA